MQRMQSEIMLSRTLGCFFMLSITGLAQGPVVDRGGVVNAASYAPVTGPGHQLAPESIATVFGQNLASGTATAHPYPLPTMLEGTTVTVHGVVAPLFYVSPGQINFQMPTTDYDPGPIGGGPVVVTTAAGASAPGDGGCFAHGSGHLHAEGQRMRAWRDPERRQRRLDVGELDSNSASPGQYIPILARVWGDLVSSQLPTAARRRGLLYRTPMEQVSGWTMRWRVRLCWKGRARMCRRRVFPGRHPSRWEWTRSTSTSAGCAGGMRCAAPDRACGHGGKPASDH